MSTDLDDHIFGGPPRGGRRASSRRDRSKERHGRGRNRILGTLITLAILGLIAWGIVGFAKPLYDKWTEPGDYQGAGTTPVSFTVNKGDIGHVIGVNLEKAGIVKTVQAFEDTLDASNGPEIQPGTYPMKKEMSASAALAVLQNQNARNVGRVTIREGLWKSETFALLSKATGRPVADYVAAAKDIAGIGLPAYAKGDVEGYLFPATYEFDQDSTAKEQLKAMVAKTVEELDVLGVPAAKREETMIVASIVEAEARRDVDRPKVARVIENRLALPMRLQLDSTVSYGVQKRAITTSDKERASDNGYNTYVHDGLPKGPISNPGVKSIEAATKPATGPWLYFVAINPDTGETNFAVTAAQHAANVALFQKWCRDNPGQC